MTGPNPMKRTPAFSGFGLHDIPLEILEEHIQAELDIRRRPTISLHILQETRIQYVSY